MVGWIHTNTQSTQFDFQVRWSGVRCISRATNQLRSTRPQVSYGLPVVVCRIIKHLLDGNDTSCEFIKRISAVLPLKLILCLAGRKQLKKQTSGSSVTARVASTQQKEGVFAFPKYRAGGTANDNAELAVWQAISLCDGLASSAAGSKTTRARHK